MMRQEADLLYSSSMEATDFSHVSDYIESNWDNTVRETREDSGPRLALPYPYTVPSIDDRFRELYYWDTYFTNLGLLKHGKTEQARWNVENFAHEIATYGFILNSNATYHLNRSQPPYYALMVAGVYEHTGDSEWLASVFDSVVTEYNFWMRERSTPTGLNRHYHRATREEKITFYDHTLVTRLGFPAVDDAKKITVGDHYIAEAETGMDFTPRFGGRCADFLPVDLNANLFLYEKTIAQFCTALGRADAGTWLERAAARAELMRSFMADPKTLLFHDYDYVRDTRADLVSIEMLYPMWARIASDREAEAAVAHLPRITTPHGVTTCEKTPESVRFQWGHPNVWPPMQYIAYTALLNYGYTKEASAVASTFRKTVETQFAQSGALWEKYDGITGGPTDAEYKASKMLGWTAGVYLACDPTVQETVSE
ncbi:MAG: alpha,alpha-trehalase [Spirochaetaceae bacterium]|nr:MAG: alpha,alpha-trehalase [Spirochaetaceae bacterium]